MSQNQGYTLDETSLRRVFAATKRVEGTRPGFSTPPSTQQVTPGIAMYVADFPAITAGVVSAVAGAAGSASFTMSGDFTAAFLAGFPFQVVNSTSNNGYYRTTAAGSSLVSGNTVVPVNEAILSDTSTGWVALWDIPPIPIAGAFPGAAGIGQVSVSGNYASLFLPGWTIDVVRSANNSGSYTVTNVFYNSGTMQTVFTLSPAVSSATADGYLVPHYPAPHESSTLFPACTPTGVSLQAGGLPTWAAGSTTGRFCSASGYVPRGSLVVLSAGIPVSTYPRRSFIYVGGGVYPGSVASSPRVHSRLDASTGAEIWTRDRGAALYAIAADNNGCCYTGGQGTVSNNATIPVTLTQVGTPLAFCNFQVDGDVTSTFGPGFMFTVTGSSNQNGSYTVSSSVSDGGRTVIYTTTTINGPGVISEFGTINYATSGGGSTIEKWDSNGNKLWGASVGIITAIAVDKSGNVYAGSNAGVVTQLDPLGNTLGSFSLPSPFAGLAINGIAVDPIDGRIAVVFGNLAGLTAYGLGGAQYEILIYESGGTQITGLNWQSDGGLNPVGGSIGTYGLASCAFNVSGNLFAVGVASAGSSTIATLGYVFTPDSNKENEITWPETQSSPQYAIAHSVACDGLGRCLVGSQVSLAINAGAIGGYGPLHSIGLLRGDTTNYWLFKLVAEQQCWSIAADRSGAFFAVCTAPSYLEIANPAQVYAFDPTGKPLWANNYWQGLGNSGTLWDGLGVPGNCLVAVA